MSGRGCTIDPMSRLVDDAIAHYERRRPKAAAAYDLDSTHNALTKWMESVLYLVDMVLEDEEVPVGTRRNVARCILYGSPNPADAQLRMEQVELMQNALKMGPPSVALQMPEGWTMPEEWKR